MTPTIVASHYNAYANDEHTRLLAKKIEFAITLRTILFCIPASSEAPSGVKIADIGGGTGCYSVELAKRGYQVTLIDISQSELDIAAQHAEAHNVRLEDVFCADASRLSSACTSPPHLSFDFTSAQGTFDIVLLLGPLYDLLSEADRIRTLSSCVSLVKPGGTGYLLASFVTRAAHLRDMAQKDPARLVWEWRFYESYVENGKYTRRAGTESYHVRDPGEMRELFRKVNEDEGVVDVEELKLVAAEGSLGGGLDKRIVEELGDGELEGFEKWIDVLWGFAGEEWCLGGADHVLALARKV